MRLGDIYNEAAVIWDFSWACVKKIPLTTVKL